MSNGDTEEKIKIPGDLQAQANDGDAEAQYRVGELFFDEAEREEDSEKDYAIYAKAVDWYQRAAKQGHADAQFSLGRLLEEGRGTALDKAKAFEWYQKAAEQGQAWAQVNLGAMCDDVAHEKRRSKEEAAAWLKTSIDWYKKAADQGNAMGKINYALMLYGGKGVTQDQVGAIKVLEEAAALGTKGSWLALSELGEIYENQGNAADAMSYYEQALAAKKDPPNVDREDFVALHLKDLQRAMPKPAV